MRQRTFDEPYEQRDPAITEGHVCVAAPQQLHEAAETRRARWAEHESATLASAFVYSDGIECDGQCAYWDAVQWRLCGAGVDHNEVLQRDQDHHVWYWERRLLATEAEVSERRSKEWRAREERAERVLTWPTPFRWRRRVASEYRRPVPAVWREWGTVTYLARRGPWLKIGHTSHLDQRMIGLACRNRASRTDTPPGDIDALPALQLLATLDGDHWETILHEHYAEHRVKGEWFAAVPVLEDLVGLIAMGAEVSWWP